MSKKRVLTSLDKLTTELKKLVQMMYPEGYEDSLVKLENHKKETIHVLSIETEDTIYLIKVGKGMKMSPLNLDDEDDDDKTSESIPEAGEFEGEEVEEDEDEDDDKKKKKKNKKKKGDDEEEEDEDDDDDYDGEEDDDEE